jgi:hypothetical protein
MTFLYTGPSWAASSYPVNDDATNLGREWGLPHINLSSPGSTVLTCTRAIHSSGPIVWIYNEPLGDLTPITGLSFEEFVTREDWKDIREECNQHCLAKINALGNPVLLIGGHSDVVNCDYPNIVVGHASWQKWIAEQAGMRVTDVIEVTPADSGNYNLANCWGPEGMHNAMHQNPDIKPVPSLVDSMWDMFYFWKELENRNWFYEAHPNKQGNVEFAKFLKPVVENFLSTT